MNLYRLELKRVCRTRMTAILLALALALAVVMAYIPVTFVGWTELDAAGNEVKYTGFAALQKHREHQVSGAVTTEVLQDGLAAYQRVFRQYGAKNINGIPAAAFYQELSPYRTFVNDAKEAFADQETGIAPGVMELTAEDMTRFYQQLPLRLASVIRMETNGHAAAQAIAQKKFAKVKTPYTYDFGVTPDAIEYETFLIFLLTLLCVVIAAPVFSTDAQTGAQDLQLCTKYGGLRLAGIRLGAAFSITGGAFLLCGVVWIVVTNTLFGWEGTKTSMQLLFSVTSLLPFTAGQLQWVNLLSAFALFAAEMAFVLAVSAWAKNNLTAMAVSLASVLLPLIVYVVLPKPLNAWAEALFPASGIALSSSLLYRLIGFDFFLLGEHAWFQADVLLALAPVKILLFLALALWGYRRKTAR